MTLTDVQHIQFAQRLDTDMAIRSDEHASSRMDDDGAPTLRTEQSRVYATHARTTTSPRPPIAVTARPVPAGRQFLHLRAYPCAECGGPVIAASFGLRENDITNESDAGTILGVCISCDHRQDATEQRIHHFFPVEWPLSFRAPMPRVTMPTTGHDASDQRAEGKAAAPGMGGLAASEAIPSREKSTT